MEGLKENKTLTSLNLRNNSIGDEGSKYIIEGLKENGCLLEIIGLKSSNELKLLLERNKKARELAKKSAMFLCCARR